MSIKSRQVHIDYINFSPARGWIQAGIYDPTGPIYTPIGTISEPTGVNPVLAHDQVTTCLDPDPLNPGGVYVAWRDRNRNAIGLQAINYWGIIWTGGPVFHVSPAATPPSQPAVTASTTWVMLAWKDWQNAILPAVPYIYGCNHDITGAPFSPWWNLAGNELSSVPATGTASWQAENPALIANSTVGPLPNQGALLAFTGTNDPTYVLDDHFVYTRFIPADPATNPNPGNLGVQKDLTFVMDGTITSLGDKEKSLYGYRQRKPMFTQVGVASSQDYWPSGTVLCAFQTRPYSWTTTSPTNVQELANYNLGLPMYAQSNISMRTISVDFNIATNFNLSSTGHACLTSSENAQELESIQWGSAMGPVATYTSYDYSDNFAGDVRNVSVNPNVCISPAIVPTLHVPGTGACATNTALLNALSAALTVFDQSAIPLNPANFNVSWHLNWGNANVFASNLPPFLSPHVPYLNIIQYTPQNIGAAGCANDNEDENLNLKIFNNTGGLVGGTNMTFVVANGQGYSPKTVHPGASTGAALSISAFPNPSIGTSTLTIKGPQGHSIQIALVNLLGEEVMRMQDQTLAATAIMLPLDLSNFVAGTYVIRVQADDGEVESSMITLKK